MREKVINGSKLVLICFHPQRRERKMGPGEVWDKRIYLWASAKRFLSGRSKCIYILLELKLFRSHHLNIGWCLGMIASSTVTVPLNSDKHLFQGHSSLRMGLLLTTSAQWLVGLANTRLLPLIIENKVNQILSRLKIVCRSSTVSNAWYNYKAQP